MKNRKIMTAVLLIVGILLLWGGAGGFYTLYTASKNCERATGIVQSINTQKVYRHRKIRYDSRMLVTYPTPQHGKISVSMKNYNPFRKKGDEVLVWYDPNLPREACLPYSDALIWGILVASGLFCVWLGLAIRKETETTEHTNE